MRYGIHLLPDAFLLVVLLRMTFVGLAAERCAIFFFLCAWLLNCFVTLFLGQLWPTDSKDYATGFFILSAFAWLAGVPALWLASRSLSRTPSGMAMVIVTLLLAWGGCYFVVENSSMAPLAKLLAVNCWIAVVAGAIFWFASVKMEGPDFYLWRCCGVFFLLFGFGYMFIGIFRPGVWAYVCLVLAATVVWIALAWFIGPHPDHLFNLEKLALVPSVRLRIALAARSQGQRND
jgi:hypothetical protein